MINLSDYILAISKAVYHLCRPFPGGWLLCMLVNIIVQPLPPSPLRAPRSGRVMGGYKEKDREISHRRHPADQTQRGPRGIG